LAWEELWQRKASRAVAAIRGVTPLAGLVATVAGNATQLPFPNAAFDAIVCDPPYFDNIDYAEAADSHYGWMRLVLAPIYPEIFAAPCSPRAAEIVVHRQAPDPEAERRQYEESIRLSIAEAARVLKPDRCVAVLYAATDVTQLAEFLALIQPGGIELAEVVRVKTERVTASSAQSATPSSFVLLLRKSREIAALDQPAANAARVLELADVGQPNLLAAVVEILEAEWQEVDIDATIPSEYAGTNRQRISEYVRAHPDPRLLLRDLGAPTLRRHAQRLGLESRALGADATALAREILVAIGFAVPEPPEFLFAREYDRLVDVVQQLSLARSEQELRGAFMTGASTAERILRYATVGWLVALAGHRWEEAMHDLFSRVSEVSFPGVGELALGYWKALFCKLPDLRDDASEQLQPTLAQLRRVLRRGKVEDRLNKLIATRNRVEHDKEEFLSRPLEELREAMRLASQAGETAIGDLLSRRVLPQVLQPMEEHRDRWGRLRLELQDERRRTVEMWVDSPTDLTRRLDPAKPGEMSQVSGGEVELVDVGGDRLIESVELSA